AGAGRDGGMDELVVVAVDTAVEGEADGVDQARLARAGRAGEGEEVGALEVDRGRLAEGGEALDLEPLRPHGTRPATRRTAWSAARRRCPAHSGTRRTAPGGCGRFGSTVAWRRVRVRVLRGRPGRLGRVAR